MEALEQSLTYSAEFMELDKFNKDIGLRILLKFKNKLREINK